MRAPGMSWSRLPLFVWSILAYSLLLIIALPVIAGAVTMLLLDRHFGTHFFDAAHGGSALLWQNLFWFFGHPEVYILILPAFGIISEVLPVFARKPIFGYKAIAASTIMISFLGLLRLGPPHVHDADADRDPRLRDDQLVPDRRADGIKIFNWIGTLWQGSIEFTTPLMFAVGIMALFTIGGLSGDLPRRSFPVDWQLQRHLLRRRPHPLRVRRRLVFGDLRRRSTTGSRR